MKELICENCKTKFEKTQNSRKRFCTIKCNKEYYKKLYAKLNPTPKCQPTTLGNVQEMRVIIDLLIRGFHVFRSCSHYAPFDIIMVNEGKFRVVEVVTGYYSGSGNINHGKKKLKKKWDYLAIVTRDGDILYEPEMEEFIT